MNMWQKNSGIKMSKEVILLKHPIVRALTTAFRHLIIVAMSTFELLAEDESVDAIVIEQNSKVDQSSKEKNKTEKIDKLSGSFSFFSDYRSRGLSETMHQPGIQGEIKYTHHLTGCYLKTWASNIGTSKNLINNASMEWDFFVGIENKISQSPFSYDIGLIFYYYPGGKADIVQNTSYNTLEYYIGFEYQKIRFKIYQTLTDFYGINSNNPPTNFDTHQLLNRNGSSAGSTYFELEYDWVITPKFKIFFHSGYQIIINYPKLNYSDWQLGSLYEFDWIQAVLYYSGTTANSSYYNIPDNAYHPKKSNVAAHGFVFGVIKTF